MYTIRILRRAQTAVAALPPADAARVRAAIAALTHDPRPSGCKKLKAESALWRIRAGDYRVVYTIDDAVRVITITKVGHRRDVYR